MYDIVYDTYLLLSYTLNLGINTDYFSTKNTNIKFCNLYNVRLYSFYLFYEIMGHSYMNENMKNIYVIFFLPHEKVICFGDEKEFGGRLKPFAALYMLSEQSN